MGFPYALLTIGCKVNRVEIDSIGAVLDGAGCVRANDESVRAVFINTCTVTAEADKKTRKTVRHALRAYPGALVFVMGCAVAIDPEEYLSYSSRVHVVSKAKAVQTAFEILGVDARLDASNLRIGRNYPTRVNLKVQDGCDNSCTYCIVHVARGKSVSVPFEQVINEAVRYGEAGVRELVLSGINLATYDDNGRDIADLMEALLEAHPGYRLRLGSVEPLDVTEKLIDLMARRSDRICHHLHLPLQSGSSKVLLEMNRGYTAEFFRNLVDKLYASMPDLSLSTDIIVAFPGETEEDFLSTLDVARHARFSKIHVFRYSKRDGTPAALRDDQVSSEESSSRAKRLSELGDELRRLDMQQRSGTKEQVLVEQLGRGMTGSYHGIILEEAEYPVGSLVEITLPKNMRNGMYLL